MSLISKVIPKDDYLLEVQFDNGSSIIINLEERLKTIRFGPLADKEFFSEVTTDGINISWHGKVEITINELFLLALK